MESFKLLNMNSITLFAVKIVESSRLIISTATFIEAKAF